MTVRHIRNIFRFIFFFKLWKVKTKLWDYRPYIPLHIHQSAFLSFFRELQPILVGLFRLYVPIQALHPNSWIYWSESLLKTWSYNCLMVMSYHQMHNHLFTYYENITLQLFRTYLKCWSILMCSDFFAVDSRAFMNLLNCLEDSLFFSGETLN